MRPRFSFRIHRNQSSCHFQNKASKGNCFNPFTGMYLISSTLHFTAHACIPPQCHHGQVKRVRIINCCCCQLGFSFLSHSIPLRPHFQNSPSLTLTLGNTELVKKSIFSQKPSSPVCVCVGLQQPSLNLNPSHT